MSAQFTGITRSILNLAEIKQALDHETTLQESAKAQLRKNLEQIETLKKLTQQAQSAWEAANHSLQVNGKTYSNQQKKCRKLLFMSKLARTKSMK